MNGIVPSRGTSRTSATAPGPATSLESVRKGVRTVGTARCRSRAPGPSRSPNPSLVPGRGPSRVPAASPGTESIALMFWSVLFIHIVYCILARSGGRVQGQVAFTQQVQVKSYFLGGGGIVAATYLLPVLCVGGFPIIINCCLFLQGQVPLPITIPLTLPQS